MLCDSSAPYLHSFKSRMNRIAFLASCSTSYTSLYIFEWDENNGLILTRDKFESANFFSGQDIVTTEAFLFKIYLNSEARSCLVPATEGEARAKGKASLDTLRIRPSTFKSENRMSPNYIS